MKRIFAFTALLIGLATTSNAQQAESSKKEITKEQKQKLKDELDLTKEQAKELKDVNKEFKEKASTIKEDNSLTKEQKKEKLQSLNTERMTKTNTILSPEQQEKVSRHKKAGHSKRQRPLK